MKGSLYSINTAVSAAGGKASNTAVLVAGLPVAMGLASWLVEQDVRLPSLPGPTGGSNLGLSTYLLTRE